MLEKSGDDLIQRFADELRHIEDDPRWQRIDDAIWLYFREINGIRIGVILATNNDPRFDTFALNCGEIERLLKGKREGKTDLIAVVAVRTNEDGQREHCCTVEAEALFERIRHKTPKTGKKFGPFWSLTQNQIEGVESQF